MTQWCCRKLFPRARMKVLKAGQVYGMFLLKIKVTRVHSKHRRLQERLEVPGLSSWIQDTWLTCDVKVYVSFHSPYFIGSHATVDSRNSRVGHSQGASRLQKKRQLQRKDKEPLDTPWDISERDMIRLFHCLNRGRTAHVVVTRNSPLAEPQQEWKNNRKAGPQETGGYDIRLIWGLQAYLSRAAGVTITDLKPRCGTARPTLWGGQGHANERGRSRPSLLFGWPVITNATW